MIKKNFITFLLLSFISHAAVSTSTNSHLHLKSIYNLDDRELIDTSSAPLIREIGKSIALIVYSDDLKKDENNETSHLKSFPITEKAPKGSNYCPTEKFSNHIAYKKGCTGFLIGKDILVSAGHCFKSKNDCHKKKIIFDVTANKEDTGGFKIQNEDIYECSKILAQEYDPIGTQMDYSIIQLDHKVGNRPVLKTREAKSISSTDSLFMIGHPLGLPLTYSKGAKIIDNSSDIFFESTLDSFHGNSGSPVFNAETYLVEGILVSGEVDEDYNEEGKCYRYATYSDTDESKGEGVTRITHLIPHFTQDFD